MSSGNHKHSAHLIDRLLLGRTGRLAVWVILGAGQLIWLGRALGSIDLADAVAIEGIIVAVSFGIVAVRVALFHAAELRTVSGSLGGVSERLEGVSDSVQAQPIGEFPHFLPQITELLTKAEKSIVIMCDAPGYGIYSNGPEFDKYSAALKTKIASLSVNDGFSVDLMFLGDREREQVQRDATQRYVPTVDQWDSWRDLPEVSQQLIELAARVRRICQPEAPSMSAAEVSEHLTDYSLEDFISDINEVDEALLARDFYGARRRVLIFEMVP